MTQKKILKTIAIILLSIIGNHVTSQNLITSRKTSYLTYIYKLTDKETEKIYKRGLSRVDSSYLHSLVDTYPTDSAYRKKLHTGHYLHTYSYKNKQMYRYQYVPAFETKILNNNTDLCVQVLQPDGKIIRDASVFLGNSRLTYDEATQCFVRRKTSRNGLLKVTVNGQTAYYQIKKKLGLTPFLRSVNSLQYKPPFNFIVSPIWFLIHLPVDAVKSIRYNEPCGVIWNVDYIIHHSGIALFHMLHPSIEKRYDGYLVLNKPKYLPGDSVMFKAYIVNWNRKPFNKPVYANIFKDEYNLENPIFRTKIHPYRPGSYDFNFKLDDSLNLKLDNDYKIILTDGREKYYIGANFRYEQYELNPLQLSVNTETNKHYQGSPTKLKIKGTDDNGLNLMDARVEIKLITKEIKQTFDNITFVPDTLWTCIRDLNPVGETVLTLPDSVFPKANFSYTAQVRLLTSDNKTLTQTKELEYFFKRQNIDFKVLTDSIEIAFKENDIRQSKQVTLFGTDFFGNKVPLMNAVTPFRVAINPGYKMYIAESDTIKRTLDMTEEQGLLNCITDRSKDSLFIRVSNPRKLHFTYNIYRRNTETNRGSGNSLNINQSIHTKENYYISLRYLWAGSIKEETQRIAYYDKKLNVKLIQPELIYPGQKVNMGIEVTDQAGKPVEGVDLTAFSVTGKFGYKQPDIPYLGKIRQSKDIVNNFNFQVYNEKLMPAEFMLDYPKWEKSARLDSIEFYKFLYPGNEIYRFEYPAEENITQFAPYVISDKGYIEPVHIVYVDNRPVYFSWTDNVNPYSFRIDSLPHQITLRTHETEITLKDMKFRSGYKTIFSFNRNINKNNVQVLNTTYAPTALETEIANKYTLVYNNKITKEFAYITDGRDIRLITPKIIDRGSYGESGPFLNKSLKLVVPESFSESFSFYPNFNYSFDENNIQTREVKPDFKYFGYRNFDREIENLNDMTLTVNSINNFIKDYTKQLRPNFVCNNPWKFSSNCGQFQLKYGIEYPLSNIPVNQIFISYDNDEHIRIFSGLPDKSNLLEAGKYRIVSLYADSSYSITDSVNISPNGTNVITFNFSPQRIRDVFGDKVNSLFDKTVINKKFTGNDLVTLQGFLFERFKFEGGGRIISGTIKDRKTSNSIMGAFISVIGTNYGTVSNADGSFSMKIPYSAKAIKITHLKYDTIVSPINQLSSFEFELHKSALAPKDILVGDYSKPKFEPLERSTGILYKIRGLVSVDDALQGKISGLDVVGNSGGNWNITNQSVSADEKIKPLYIVDGLVYAGDISKIDPSAIESTEELNAGKAMALYGSMASNGAVVITTKSYHLKTQLAKEGKGAEYDQDFLEAASKATAIRNNFSDYAFWQPRLITDKQGKASFEVTFPDDVTRWQTHVLAMNGNRQSGQTSGDVKSYKPLMAQLAVPNFMVENDSTTVVGKALNYLPDSVRIQTSFSVNNGSPLKQSHVCTNASLDSLPVVATTDTLSLRYTLSKSGGYTDGEVRKVPVFPIGLEETKGTFAILDKDTTFIPATDASSEWVLHADAGYLDLMSNEIGHIMSYAYFCNEQIASKLNALLANRSISNFKGKAFRYDAEINDMIRLLLKNRKTDGGWGWWKDSETHFEFSAYILQALAEARKQGFKVRIDPTELARQFVYFLEFDPGKNLSRDLALLKSLKTFDAVLNYPGYIGNLDKMKQKTLTKTLKLMELKQLCGMSINTDILKDYRQKTMIGSLYFSDKNSDRRLMDNDIENTLIAYRIIRREKKESSEELASIRRYFMEKKQSYCRWNTYEAAQIMQTILPDILTEKQKWVKSKLEISGDITQTVNAFPFALKIKPGQKITVSKTGNDPVYFSTFHHYFNPAPLPKATDFIVNTQFSDQLGTQLKAGKAVKLIVNLKVLKDADYVMLRIPIPAGCSYGEKIQPCRNEVHREYFKNETAIFCQKLTKGKYTFEINLLPRFTGHYTLNPAKAELMYFPVFNGNNELKRVDIY